MNNYDEWDSNLLICSMKGKLNVRFKSLRSFFSNSQFCDDLKALRVLLAENWLTVRRLLRVQIFWPWKHVFEKNTSDEWSRKWPDCFRQCTGDLHRANKLKNDTAVENFQMSQVVSNSCDFCRNSKILKIEKTQNCLGGRSCSTSYSRGNQVDGYRAFTFPVESDTETVAKRARVGPRA